MYSKTSATKMTRKTSVIVAALGVLQDDPEDGVADVPATIRDLFEKIVEVFPEDDQPRVLLAAVEFPQVLQQLLVRIAFHTLELLVRFLDVFEARSVPEAAYE